MNEVAITTNKIHGLQPGLNHLQNPAQGVLRGKNFRLSLKGPYSGFGNSLTAKNPSTTNRFCATFKVLDKVIYCAPDGIFEQVSDSTWVCVLPNTPTYWEQDYDNDYPWSIAFVGESYFFCHPTFGLAAYSKTTCTWTKCEEECTIEDKGKFLRFGSYIGPVVKQPYYSICESNNRLVLLAYDTVSWSAPDDGYRLECDMYCGSGFQSLSINEYGRPYSVNKIPTGFLVYTSNGLVRADELDNQMAFKFKHVSTQQVPINPHCVITHDSEINYFLSKTGLCATDGRYPEMLEPIVSEYLVHNELRNQSLLYNTHCIKLSYLPETEELFVSVVPGWHEEATDPNVYSRALVYNLTLKDWSSFDQLHTFIGSMNTLTAHETGFNSGFLDECGNVHLFDYSAKNQCASGEVTHLDSYIELGAYYVSSERKFRIQTDLKYFSVNSNPTPEFNYHLNPLHTNHSAKDNWASNSNQTNQYTAQAAPSRDGYPDMIYDWNEVSNVVPQGKYTCDFVCFQSAIYHNIRLGTRSIGDYYNINSITVVLTAYL